jgi:poly(hydroxyalkanoate) depolymerase family esterase
MPFQPTLLRAPAGEFTSGTHSHAEQTRSFKLYLPSTHAGQTLPLVVMLHGCYQTADDFAAGTGMNRRARNQGFFVLYPEQDREANPNGCWNWFMPEHQQRGHGEPALLASMTRTIAQQYGIDPKQVFIAGMSAGGAMACIMANTYPELFAAVGVHSGLPIGAASNIDEALTVMNQGDSNPSPAADEPLPQHVPIAARQHTPTIVFHGDQDSTVHPSNGAQVVKAALGDTPTQMQVKQGSSSSGRHYTRQIYTDTQHRVLAEYWLVHDTGHAWSGGSLQGSYTDRHGPDASAEMLRFFFAKKIIL